MNRQQAVEWLGEGGAELGEYEGEPFVIVEAWATVEASQWEDVLEVLDIGEFGWGFSDEYTTCSDCGDVIRTSPDSYSWTPDFWLNSDYGEILCGDCVRQDPDDYIDWLIEQARQGQAVGCHLVSPEDHGFRVIAEGLENELHDGQADDPRKLISELTAAGFDLVYTVRPSQFYASFDLWLRYENGEPLSDLSVEQLKKLLLEDEHLSAWGNRSYLKREFRQDPSPAENCRRALATISREGLRFAAVQTGGSVLDYETETVYE